MHILSGEIDLEDYFEPSGQFLPWLVGVVAIFVPLDGSTKRFIYLPDHQPFHLPENAVICDWSDLPTLKANADLYILQDGHLFIDHLAENVIHVYHLKHLFQEYGHFAELRQTWLSLAQLMATRLDTLSEDGVLVDYDAYSLGVRIYALAFPSLLENIPRRGLVFAIPLSTPKQFVESLSCRLVYVGAPPETTYPPGISVERLTEDFWQNIEIDQPFLGVSVLAEAKGIPAQVPLLEMGRLLHDSGLYEDWSTTLGDIAKDASTMSHSNDSSMALRIKLVEVLSRTKCTDLLAVVMPDDLQEFLANERALYLFQDLQPRDELSLPNGSRRLAIEHFLHTKEARKEFGTYAFSLEMNIGDLAVAGIMEIRDLTTILLEAGKGLALGETTWKAVRLLPDQSPNTALYPIFGLLVLCLNNLADTSYGNMARSEYLFESLYYALVDLLEMYVNNSDPRDVGFYRALQIWFQLHFTNSHGLNAKLEEIVSEIGHLDENNENPEIASADLDTALAHILQRTCSIMSSQLNRGGQPDRIGELIKYIGITPHSPLVRASLFQTTKSAIAVPSEAFLYEALRFSRIERHALDVRWGGMPIDRKIITLQEISNRFRSIPAFINCAPHEKVLLRELYEYAYQNNESFIQQISGAPWLEASCLEQEIHLREPASLTIVLRNNGQARAENIEVELIGSHDFNILDERALRLSGSLMADDGLRETFQIEGQRKGQTTVHLKVTYLNGRKKESLEFRFPLGIIEPTAGFWETKQNPYTFGSVVKDCHQYFGRKDLLNSLVQNLVEKIPQNTLLGGGRRSGKTSTFFMLLGILEDRDRKLGVRNYFQILPKYDQVLNSFAAVYVDLQALTDPERVERIQQNSALVQSYRKGDDRPSQTWISPSALFRKLLIELEKVRFTSEQAMKLKDQKFIEYEAFKEVFTDLCARNSDRKLLILLDEFDKFADTANQEPAENLRNLISVIGGATWFVSSAYGYIEAFGDYRSPLFNVFSILSVERLDSDSAINLITSPWLSPDDLDADPANTLKFLDDAVDALIFETGCQPFFIQLLCQEIIKEVNRRRTNYVRLDLVTEIIKHITTTGTGPANLDYLWDNLPASNQSILVILIEDFHHVEDTRILVGLLNWLETTGLDMAIYPDIEQAFEKITERSFRQLQAAGTIVKRSQDNLIFYSLGIPMARHIFKINRAQIIKRFKRQILDLSEQDQKQHID